MNRIFFFAALVLATSCGGEPLGLDAGALPDSGSLPDAAQDAGDQPDTGTAVSDAGRLPEACTVPGERRTVACGNCGVGAEECSDALLWESTSACLNQGECATGVVESATAAMCEMRQRICDVDCTWRPWSIIAPVGECEPDALRLVETTACGSGRQPQRCSATCAWEDDGPCSDGCGDTARTSPEWAREVCIPAGPFLRGEPGTGTASNVPQSEIMMSGYYIDAYPVTVRRYRECLAAGGCARVMELFEEQLYDQINDDALLDYPVTRLTWQRAEALCAWDGGRNLPTEAQWEKAARGPAPRAQAWPWDDNVFHCEYITACASDPNGTDPYNGFPMTRSYYGTFLQYGGTYEWTSDWYASDWYRQPESLVADPTGPASGTQRSIRGSSREGASVFVRLTRRTGGSVASFHTSGVRCSRPADGP